MSRRAAFVGVAVSLATVMAVSGPVGAWSGRAAPPPAPATAAAGTGGVAINGTQVATANPNVSLTIPSPTTSASLLRISNDGGVTNLEVPWATSVAWSLIDAAAGGVDADGTKTVSVSGGDGIGAWAPVGAASILLDRAGPVVTGRNMTMPTTQPRGNYEILATDSGVGVDHTEISFDNVHWRSLDPAQYEGWSSGTFDVRETIIGGSWTTDPRTVYGRVFDKLGNVTPADPYPITVTDLWSNGEPPISMKMPLPAVTGQSFTLEPVQGAYRVPPGHTCAWTLWWGSEKARTAALPDPTYGEVETIVNPVNGICQPWTFTLPYTPALEYSWFFAINSDADTGDPIGDQATNAFRAAPGGTYRGIQTSSNPLYYTVPDRDYVGVDGTVTYRLYRAGGAPPRSGQWVCRPANPASSVHGNIQQGGTSFACRVTTSEPWVASWSYWSSKYRFYAAFDPIGDRRRPTMTSVRATPAPGTAAGSSMTARLTWRGTDKGTGIRRYTVQVSTSGGAWKPVSLPSSPATSVDRVLAVGTAYRFRVRATDRAGNVSNWLYTPTLRPKAYDDATSAATWSAGWVPGPLAGALGGSVRTASAAGAAVTFTFTGQSVGLLAPRGAAFGFAQVYVDGKLAATLNLAAAASAPNRVAWQTSWAASGAHKVRVRVLGTVGHPATVVDGFVVLR